MNIKELHTLLSNITILYVEDDSSIREEMTKVLSNFTQNIQVAETGYEGLELYKEHKPQIIISDIMMPKLDGLAFVEQIREDNLNIPIILLTAFTDKEYLLPAANLNIQSYLVKPIKSQELKEALYKAVKLLNQNTTLFIEFPNEMKYDKLNSELLDDNGTFVKLNKKEKMLLDLLVDNANRVVTYSEIENHVWSDYYEVMTSMALRTIIKNLRKKTTSELIENVSGQGYKITL